MLYSKSLFHFFVKNDDLSLCRLCRFWFINKTKTETESFDVAQSSLIKTFCFKDLLIIEVKFHKFVLINSVKMLRWVRDGSQTSWSESILNLLEEMELVNNHKKEIIFLSIDAKFQCATYSTSWVYRWEMFFLTCFVDMAFERCPVIE